MLNDNFLSELREVYKDITYVTTDNAIQPTLDFKVPSNMGGIMQGNSQNINKLYKLINEVVDKTDITTTIGPMSTHTQVPSAKTMYDTLKITLIGSKQLSAYGKEIVKYPLGRWGTMGMGVKNLTDLPNDDVKYVEILGISDSATPWTVGLSTRTYRATTEDGAIFTRSITSGEQGGVIEKDTGWQKVSYTKIPDVPVTTISTFDTQNFYSTANKVASKYAVVDGECEVSLFIKADTPASSLVTVFTGLPKAKMPIYSTLNGWENANDYVIVQINALGSLSLIKGTAGEKYVGSIRYRVVE